MPLPFILGAAAIAAAGYGVKKGVDAKSDHDDAERYQRWAREEAESANTNLDKQKSKTNTSLQKYGKTKQKGIENIRLFDSLICYPDGTRRGNQLKMGRNFANAYPKIIITPVEEAQILRELHIIDSNASLSDVRQKIKAHRLEMEAFSTALQSITNGGLAGLAAGGGAYLGVGYLGAASTGTAISGLSGAAATNATLAWLGGGSLASGGLGMAGGAMVLGGLVAGPALAIAGAFAASKMAEKKQEAYELWKKIEAEAEKIKVVISKLSNIARYTDECNDTFTKLNNAWAGDNFLGALQDIASKNVRFSDLSKEECALVKASYEMCYLLYDFINEPTMNKEGDDALPEKERLALTHAKGKNEVKSLKYIPNYI